MLQFLHPSRFWSFVVQARGTRLRLVGCGTHSHSPLARSFPGNMTQRVSLSDSRRFGFGDCCKWSSGTHLHLQEAQSRCATMTTKVHFVTGEQRTLSVTPNKRRKAVSEDNLRADETLNVVYTSDRSFTADSIPEELQVGTAGSSHSAGLGQQLQSLTEEVRALATKVQTQQEDALLFSVHFVRNVAAETLLFVCKEQSPESQPFPTRRFQDMARAGSSQLTAYLAAWAVPPSNDAFANAADAVISRRNSTLHYSGLANLEEDISEARQLLTRH